MNRKKLIAFSISLAMTVVPVTPAAAAGAEQNTEGLQNAVLDLEFENSLEDSSGKGNGQKYRCVITGADGRSVTSEAAVLTVISE